MRSSLSQLHRARCEMIKFRILSNKISLGRSFSNSAGTNNKLVYISRSNDVFSNLALEDWIYRNLNFANGSLLMLWVNSPCVVIGRHQNPWTEANLCHLSANDIHLARRNSGGGTVYHDTGNLNCTFFTSREKYNRKRNLDLICEALIKNWNLNVEVSPREDIVLDQKFKISGTASKLGNKNAYHHCTLLINVDSSKLVEALNVAQMGVESKATASVRSQTLNLSEYDTSITVDSVSKAIEHKYFGMTSCGSHIDPTEENFPGLQVLREDFCSWQWIYGKTPKFTVRCPLKNNRDHLEIEVQKGMIENIHLVNVSASEMETRTQIDLLSNCKLNRELVKSFNSNLLTLSKENGDNVRFKELITSLCSITL